MGVETWFSKNGQTGGSVEARGLLYFFSHKKYTIRRIRKTDIRKQVSLFLTDIL